MTQLYSVKKHNKLGAKLTIVIGAIALVTSIVGVVDAFNTTNLAIEESQRQTTIIQDKHHYIDQIKPIFSTLRQLNDVSENRQRRLLANQTNLAKQAVYDMQSMESLEIREGKALIKLSAALDKVQSFLLPNSTLSSQAFDRNSIVKINQTASDALAALNDAVALQSSQQHQQLHKNLSTVITWTLAGFIVILIVGFLLFQYASLVSRFHKTVKHLPAAQHDMEKVFNHLPHATLVLDIAGNIIYANKHAYILTQYSETQLAPMHIGQLIDAPGSKLYDAEIKKINEHDSVEVMVNFMPNSAPIMPVRLTINSQKINYVELTIITVEDITEQARLQKSYLANQEMFAVAETLSNTGAWRWDFNSDKLFWSKQVYELYGYQPNELVISNDIILSLIPQDEREDVSNAINESMIFGKPYDQTHRIINKDGTQVLVRQQASIIRDDTNKAIGMMGIICKAQVPNSEIAEQQLFNKATDAMVITDKQGIVERVNPAFTNLTGYTGGEVEGKAIGKISRGPYFDQTIYSNIWDKLTANKSWQGELWNTKANGIVYPTYQYFSQLSDDNSSEHKYLCSFNDISEKKHIDELLSNHSIENLTKLPSRNVLFDRITHAIKRHERDKKHTVVILLSLETELVPDKALLTSVSTRLKEMTRAHDSIARFGLYEFIIVLEGITKPEDGYIVSDKIAKSFVNPFEQDKQQITLSCNIGIAMHPLHSANDVLLLNYADAAMQYAKANTTANIQVFNEKILKDYNETQHLNNQLQRAIDLSELSVQFQPIMDLNDQSVAFGVAHIRWHHAAYNNTQTYQFIDAAKNGKLREPLHAWLLTNALEQATQWPNHDLAAIKLQIKIVKEQLSKPGLAASVMHQLNMYNFTPSRLILEIEASTINELGETAQVEINALKALGVTFNVSSFNGKRPAQLSQLTALDVDSLTSIKRALTDDSQGATNIKVTEQLIVTIDENSIYPTSQAWIKNACTIDINPIASTKGQTYLVCDSVTNEKLIMLAHLLKSKSTA